MGKNLSQGGRMTEIMRFNIRSEKLPDNRYKASAEGREAIAEDEHVAVQQLKKILHDEVLKGDL
jgi:hypothetical protein